LSKELYMKKYLWVIIAGVCVVALVAVGAIFIPKLFTSTTHSGQEEVVVKPGHWWKTELTEQQLSTLDTLWGENITAAQLLQELWPDVLQQVPQEAATAYENQQPSWPTEEYEDWEGQMICGGRGVSHDEGMIVYWYYLGSHESEETTFLISVERGFTEERMYRVSLYTDIRQE
jgi:hypothetical protein